MFFIKQSTCIIFVHTSTCVVKPINSSCLRQIQTGMSTGDVTTVRGVWWNAGGNSVTTELECLVNVSMMSKRELPSYRVCIAHSFICWAFFEHFQDCLEGGTVFPNLRYWQRNKGNWTFAEAKAPFECIILHTEYAQPFGKTEKTQPKFMKALLEQRGKITDMGYLQVISLKTLWLGSSPSRRFTNSEFLFPIEKLMVRQEER